MSAPEVSTRRTRSRQVLLAELRRRDRATRAELAAVTGLSASAIASGITDLINAGLIEEDVDLAASRGGRGRRSGVLMPRRPDGHVIALDFGHMHVRVAVATTHGEVIAEQVRTIDVDNQATSALDTAGELVNELLAQIGLSRGDVLAVAAGIPGPIDKRRGTVSSPTILSSWINLDPARELQRRITRPVHVENDADMGAIGEKRFGAARPYSDYLYIKASHGIGASIVIDGHIHRGHTGIAGEIGHTTLPLAATSNRCRCGKIGCLETLISVPEIHRQADRTHLRQDPGQPPLTMAVIARDPVGARILADAGRTIGQVVADGCNWINPEAVILGGELGTAGPAFTEGFRDSLHRYAQTSTAEAVTVVTAALQSRSEIMGAVAVATGHAVAVATDHAVAVATDHAVAVATDHAVAVTRN